MIIFDQKAEQVIHKILKVKKLKKKIVLCHGAFDLIHPGHLDHFEKAKKLGDILVVTITSDRFIKKGIHNPFFKEDIRLKNLQQIKIVDYCFIVNEPSATSVINVLKPNFYCKGIEYKSKKNDKKLFEEINALKKIKGKIHFIGSNIKSSSKLISENLFDIRDNNLKRSLKLLKKIDLDKEIKNLKNLNVLVIGETIIDEYINIQTSGISPKSNTLSCVEKNRIIMPGGALATFKFVSSIAKKTKFISVINKQSFERYNKKIKFGNGIIISNKFPKIIKSRLIEDAGNKVIKKIFTINNFDEKKLDSEVEKKIITNIKKSAKNADVLIVQDFGHGMFSPKIVDVLKKFHNKISLNVQTNSLNYGFNIIGQNLKKVKMFSLDERELQLFVGKKEFIYEKEMKKLKSKLKSKIGCLTLGDKYSLIIGKGEKIYKVPKLNHRAIDTMGAGDIFHAMISLLSVKSKNDFFKLFMSQIAGAHAVEYVGNSKYPTLDEISKTYLFYINSSKN